MTNTVPVAVSPEIVEQYRADGFVRVPHVLDADEVEQAVADARLHLDRQLNESWDQSDGNVMDWIAEPELVSAALRRVALHHRITAVAAQLAGTSLRFFKSEVIRKRVTGSAGTPLHYDEPVFPFAGLPVILTAWVALVDVPVERGCMSFVLGTHRLPDGALFTEIEGYPFVPLPELAFQPRVAVPLQAGDCTFHDARTVHMAGANTTDAERLSLATVYADAAAVYEPPTMAYANGIPDMVAGQRFDDRRFPLVGPGTDGT